VATDPLCFRNPTASAVMVRDMAGRDGGTLGVGAAAWATFLGGLK
jgi:hypothetical protein